MRKDVTITRDTGLLLAGCLDGTPPSRAQRQSRVGGGQLDRRLCTRRGRAKLYTPERGRRSFVIHERARRWGLHWLLLRGFLQPHLNVFDFSVLVQEQLHEGLRLVFRLLYFFLSLYSLNSEDPSQ